MIIIIMVVIGMAMMMRMVMMMMMMMILMKVLLRMMLELENPKSVSTIIPLLIPYDVYNNFWWQKLG